MMINPNKMDIKENQININLTIQLRVIIKTEMIITNKIRDSNNLNLSCNSQKINNKLL
jgi:hypothetical protein